MEYKVLIKIYFPLIEESFEVYIPTTHTLNYIARMAQKAVVDNYNKSYVIKERPIICNKITGQIYERDKLVIDTDIRNGTKIIII